MRGERTVSIYLPKTAILMILLRVLRRPELLKVEIERRLANQFLFLGGEKEDSVYGGVRSTLTWSELVTENYSVRPVRYRNITQHNLGVSVSVRLAKA